MSKAIYKYSVFGYWAQSVHMPVGAKILSTAYQQGQLYIWALVDPLLKPTTTHKLYIALTGRADEFVDEGKFIGTAITADGNFVVHVFDLGESNAPF